MPKGKGKWKSRSRAATAAGQRDSKRSKKRSRRVSRSSHRLIPRLSVRNAATRRSDLGANVASIAPFSSKLAMERAVLEAKRLVEERARQMKILDSSDSRTSTTPKTDDPALSLFDKIERCRVCHKGYQSRLHHQNVAGHHTYMNEKVDGRVRAAKHDEGKLPLSTIPAEALADVARVMQFGLKKYGEMYGWRKGIEYSRRLDAIYRHLMALITGEDDDPESGLPHTAHIAWNAMTLQENMRLYPNLDDRIYQEWEPR